MLPVVNYTTIFYWLDMLLMDVTVLINEPLAEYYLKMYFSVGKFSPFPSGNNKKSC